MAWMDGNARTLRELLSGAKYAIDFYQREYAWQERQIRELIDDLTGNFLAHYDPAHPRDKVQGYGHYFLGSIVISQKNSRRYLVDGQQRLTTLTLLLIFLNHLAVRGGLAPRLTDLIYSEKFGTKSFNLDVPERTQAMNALLHGETPRLESANESVINIVERYENISDHFPEEIDAHALPYFIDWLLENVHVIEIVAYSDEDAYTIFETMNDRGLSLSLPEMLKGYVLSSIRDEGDQRAVNDAWKAQMQAFKKSGHEKDTEFFKHWLRAIYAETIRPGKKGAVNQDYERIGSEFHRWIRDNAERMGLKDSASFVKFVQTDLSFYGAYALKIRDAAQRPTEGWESIYYNEDRMFTVQDQLLLASLHPSDTAQEAQLKIRLVADFLDIWLARRIWNRKTTAYSSVQYTMFTLTKGLRGHDAESLSAYLRQQLEEQPERFSHQPNLRLHRQNYSQIRHILARLTHWVDTECGLASHFTDLVSKGRGRRFEIEHIWCSRYERFSEHFASSHEFDEARNLLGGLLMLQNGLNQSLGDASYEHKREAYGTKGENLLARSLHPANYTNNPSFKKFIEHTGLEFRPYERFGPTEQAERQLLYLRIAEWVWNPARLNLDGCTRPVHGPVGLSSLTSAAETTHTDNAATNQALLARLHAVAREKLDLHEQVKPHASWLSARRHNVNWNYVPLEDALRVEAYIRLPDRESNKAIFDALYAQRDAIEGDFGGPLFWQRLDGHIASRISVSVDGGRARPHLWERSISEAVELMDRLYRAIAPRL